MAVNGSWHCNDLVTGADGLMRSTVTKAMKGLPVATALMDEKPATWCCHTGTFNLGQEFVAGQGHVVYKLFWPFKEHFTGL